MLRLLFDPVYLGPIFLFLILIPFYFGTNLLIFKYEFYKGTGCFCCERRIRTSDLRVMSPTSYLCYHLALFSPQLTPILRYTVTGCLSIYFYLRSDWFVLDLYESGSFLQESNLRPTDYKSVALPAELRKRN
jgi:hypothetical protein